MDKNRLTLDELIKKATTDKYINNKYIDIYIKRIDRVIKCKNPDNSVILDALDIAKDNAHDGDLHLLYNNIIDPNIKDKKLHDAYGVLRPYDILEHIFTLGEITDIAKILLSSCNIFDKDNVTIIDDLKK